MGVLNGLKILDFSTLFPGPYATMMLADMGAEVLRVSSKSRPDLTLAAPPPIPGAPVNAVAATITRNKRSNSLNLKCPEAAGIVRKLVHTYDIVLDQFRPGVMDRLGVGYEALRRENPALIYCALTGYGQTGPMQEVRATTSTIWPGPASAPIPAGRRRGRRSPACRWPIWLPGP